MKLTVLGSGTSSGVPLVGCDCAVCLSPNQKNKRLRSSCLFEVNGKNILVDTGPDLRQQCLTHNIRQVDAVLYTHIHADHTHGIDELRFFNFTTKKPVPIYSTAGTLRHLSQAFVYIFNPSKDYPSLVPKLQPVVIDDQNFDCQGVEVIPIPCHHGATYMTMNYRIGNMAWLTDTNGIPEASLAKLQGLDFLFIDGLRHTPHPTHYHLDEVLKVLPQINAKKTYLIHLAHEYDHDELNKTLPPNVELAYDGLVVEN